MVLEPGEAAPRIKASNQCGDRVTPEFERPTVVYFYPADDTAGCTTEATEFADAYDEYETAGVEVYGVSTDGVDSHREFAADNDLPFDLLADPDGELADAFDVGLVDGRAKRTTFVVTQGQVVGVYEGVTPVDHAAEVLRDIVEAGLASAE